MRTIFNFKVMTSLFVMVMLFSACKFAKWAGRSESTPATNGNSSGTAQAFTPSGDARKDFGDSLRKLKTAYPYRLTETTSATANGQTAVQESTRVVDYAAADRIHMKWTGGTGGDLEQITIGEKRYSKSGGKWSAEAGPSMAQRMNRGMDIEKKLAEAIKEVTFVGRETINGDPCLVYTYTLQLGTYTGTGKAWVGASDGLPHQSDSDFKYGNYESKSHIVYEYKVKVNVEPPM